MDTKYLEQRRLGWFVVIDVPQALRPIIGQRRLRKSLKTRDKKAAVLKRDNVLRELRGIIAKAAAGNPVPLLLRNVDDAIRAGEQWRGALEQMLAGDHSGMKLETKRPISLNDDTPVLAEVIEGSHGPFKLAVTVDAIQHTADELRSGIVNQPFGTRRIKPDPQVADAFMAAVTGTTPPPPKPTFREVAESYVAGQKAGWKNAKHRQQWENTLATYAYPIIGETPIGDVSTDDVLRILRPIWNGKTETASRLRGRIETVIAFAATQGWRTGENPARWANHLSFHFPAKAKVAPIEHHAALPWHEIGAFMTDLRGQESTAATAALEFAILTACRTGEVLGTTWAEIDLTNHVWTIPKERMKAGREHRVPLSNAAVDVLKRMESARLPRHGDYVFPGRVARKGLSNMAMEMVLRRMKRDDLTVHGFRSAFRDWAAETTAYPADVVEMALAHTVKNKVEAAYRRGDLLQKRAALMADWSTYLTSQDPPRIG